MNDSVRHPLSKMLVLSGRPTGPMRSPARVLAWLGIGIGIAELIAPRTVARAVGGSGGRPSVTRAYGIREIATGIGLLASRDPTPWLWGRVAGDALDLASLATSVRPGNPHATRAILSLLAVGGVAALDMKVAQLAPPKAKTPSPYDYSKRSGFPKPPNEMRGKARADVESVQELIGSPS